MSWRFRQDEAVAGTSSLHSTSADPLHLLLLPFHLFREAGSGGQRDTNNPFLSPSPFILHRNGDVAKGWVVAPITLSSKRIMFANKAWKASQTVQFNQKESEQCSYFV